MTLVADVQSVHSIAADAPGLLAMAVFYLAFAAIGFFWPKKLRNVLDRLADFWKKGSWHPYRMPLNALRWAVGAVGLTGAALFIYLAYLGFIR